jgi:hypothetical protein
LLTLKIFSFVPSRKCVVQDIDFLLLFKFWCCMLLIVYIFYYQVAPGDVIELSGIFLPIPYTGFRAMRAGLVADTYLEAMSITHFKKKYEE